MPDKRHQPHIHRRLTKRQVMAILGAPLRSEKGKRTNEQINDGFMSLQELATNLKVSPSAIRNVRQGKTYKEIYKVFHADEGP